MENSRTCEICNVIVHRASYARHLTSKKNLENIIQDEVIILECFLKKSKHLLKGK